MRKALLAAVVLAGAGCAPNLIKENVTQGQADRDWRECQAVGDAVAREREPTRADSLGPFTLALDAWNRYIERRTAAEDCMYLRGWRAGF
jgi:hypothetical protein